ncbi:aldo/keto reductase [Halanaerobium saccharolyticum]|uniref:aldo/keto reductase n=1 Tax=Halanaerobium saccharolyticum TaxID=43595 RepID=UPI003FCC3B59
MQYTEFGNTGIKVSKLGFGAMRLPILEKNGEKDVDYEKSVKMIREAIDLGVNYIDTAPYYCEKKSEIAVGRALKDGYREKVYLSTKNPIENESGADWRKRLEKSLEKLDTDYIDFYHMWGISWEDYQNKIDVEDGPVEAAYQAKEDGLIKHISFSFHDDAENLFKLIDTGHFETMLVQYNLLDRSNEEAINYAQDKGMGVVVMGPVGGGRLGAPSTKLDKLMDSSTSTVETALRFVFSNQNVNIALSGMENIEMVRQNVEIASNPDPLSKEELADVKAMLEQNQKLADLYCTGCEYCLPCPQGVKIPKVFELMNYDRVYDLTAYAREKYKKLIESEKEAEKAADACVECGICEEKCPQNIEIIEQLKESHKALA